uniref:Metallophos domain-containing protein n=1 Tax=Bursaphelenchus xylophilus TaxID=6326 RepID=A0A1I7RXG3_BURXY
MDLRLVLHISCLLISTNSLRFLQIADFHYDPDYNSNGVAAQMCHEQKNSTKTKKLGEFGDYLCDSPAKLVENAVQAAAKTLAEPDLLLWTGDNIPHIDEYTEESDPAGQFEFTKKALAQAQSNNQTAHIIAHIPPGLYDRVPNIKWFTDEYNKQFLDIIRAYKDTIKLLIFGHHHGDTFHVIRDSNDSPINVAYISPAVTPWYSGLGLGANNPSFRVFDYNLESKEVTNVYTYNVNLTALNDNPSTPWTLEYSFKDAYGIPDFSPQSFHNLVEGFSKNETLFGTYMLYNTVSTDGSLPNSTIKQAQICSLNHADYDKYSVCISGALSKICSIFSIFFMMMLIML